MSDWSVVCVSLAVLLPLVLVWVMSADSVADYLPHADGFIVGSAFKADNDPAQPVGAGRVRQLMAALG